ncbi:kinase-like domain-containing protein [Chytriomyces sp. MP71]|nr:kinase-like domain-containing protein [Chytriomyces sp. MP71]
MDYEALPSISSSGDSAAQQAFSGYTDTSNNLSESCFNQGYYDRFFVEIKKLGRGLRGSVFLVQHVLDTIYLGDYAVKSIPIGTSHSWLVRQLQEVHLLEKLRHPNIIHYKHAWIEHKQLTLFGPKVPCLFILMELANGGSLEDFIYLQHIPDLDEAAAPPSKEARSHRLMVLRQRQKAARMGPAAAFNSPESVHARTYGGIGTDVNGRRVRYLTKRQIWALFLDICEGLAHLHRNGIIHRDLKPPNLLLQFASRDRSGDPDEIPRVLISDFGECEDTAHPTPDSAPPHHRTGATGTLEFMSPELLQRDPATGRYTQQQHTRQGDLYSLGVVLYFLCYSCVPFDAALLDDVDALREEILTLAAVRFPVGGHERRVPGTLQRLVERLMDRDPAERPGVEEILEFYRGARARFDDEAAGGEDEEEAGSASERRAERRGLSFTDERE